MPELGSLLRDHYEAIAPPIDVEHLTDRLHTQERLRPASRVPRGVLVAVATALIVLLVVGGTTLLIQFTRSDVIEETPPTTMVPDEPAPLPDPTPEVAPDPDGVAVPRMADVGLPFTVLDRNGDVGAGASVIVGDDGIPVVAYAFHPTVIGEPSEIRIARCGDAACTAPGDVTTIADLHQPSVPPEQGSDVYVAIRALLPDDGVPIVVWREWDEAEDGGASFLRTYKCSDPTCSGGTLTTIDDHAGSGLWAAVGPDNLPLTAQRTGDWNNIGMTITKCTDPSCAGAVETERFEMPGVGWGLTVTVDDANLPVIVAEMAGEGDGSSSLALARCSDPICAEPPQLTDLGIPANGLSAVALDPQNRPIILTGTQSSGPESSDQLMLVACTDATCSASPVVTPLITLGSDGEPFGSLAMGAGGAVAIANSSGGTIRVATCATPQCGGGVDVAVLPDASGWPTIDIALGSAGRPVIAIHTNSDLGVFVCDDTTCATSQRTPLSDVPGPDWATTTVSRADVSLSGTNPAIGIGPDGSPVIGYLGFGSDLGPEGERVAGPKLLVCDDTECATPATQPLNDEAAWVAMTTRPNGLPVAVYTAWTDDFETDQLFVAWCEDPKCSSWTAEKIDETDWFNSTTRIASRPDGSIVIVYQNGNYYVSVVSCEDADSFQIDSLVDPNDTEWGLRWWMNSLDVAVLPDGRPVIAAAQSNGELRYVECTDPTCTDSRRATIDQTLEGVTSAIAVGPNGLPVLSYYDDGELTVAACHDTGCNNPTLTALSEATAAGTASVTPSVAFGSDGNPMIAYWAPRALVLAECHNPMCTSSTVDVFAAVRTYDLAVLPNGSPILAYFAYSDREPPAGEEEFGALVDLRLAICTSGTCVAN
jgi:hypothetical protein